MQLAEIRTLFDYDTWGTDRILAQAAKLTPAQFTTAPNATMPAVRQILAHIMGAQILWRTRFETGTANISVGPDDFPDVAALRGRLAEERRAMRAYLDTLTDDDLAGSFRFARRGETLELPRWQILFQLINHGTQHRSEVAALLSEHGHSPGDLDFLHFLLASA